MNVKPLGDRVLIQSLDVVEELKGGIFIPDSAKEKPQEGKVVAVGTGKRDEKGELIAFSVKVGDTVLLPKYGGTEVKIGEDKYQIVKEDDILAIIE
ncbi:MAG: co-chaperone GroES [Kiritimatiellae bacterium]|jgi:chaperonin GroES|nr:co-chaperone GroES [Kiritimatiellia bacterium]